MKCFQKKLQSKSESSKNEDKKKNMSGSSASSIVTLVTAPPCFGLPSLSLESTAVETIFKLGRIDHRVERQEVHQQQRRQSDDESGSSSISSNAASRIPRHVHDAAIHSEAAVYHQCSSGEGASSILLENADFLPTPVVYDANSNSNNHNSRDSCSNCCWPPHLAAHHAVSVSRLDVSLSDEESAATQALTEMIRSSLFPAIEFLWLVDDGDFNTCVAPVWDRRTGRQNRQRKNSEDHEEDEEQERHHDTAKNQQQQEQSGRAFWDRLLRPLSNMRLQRISRLKSIGRFATVDDAFIALEKGFATIEKYLAAARRRDPSFNPVQEGNASASSQNATNTTTSDNNHHHSSTNKTKQPQYFFGRHNQPSSVDGFVFAAVSAIVFGEFTESSPLRAFQNQAVFSSSSSSTSKSNTEQQEHEQLATTLRLPLCRKYAEDLASYFKKIASSSIGTLAKYFIDVNDLSSKKERERLLMIQRKERREAEDPFARGRQETLIAIGLTLATYVIMVNWKTIRKM